MIDSKPLVVIEGKSFTKTAKVKGEEVKIERVFNRTVNSLDSQGNGGYGVRETYIPQRGGKSFVVGITTELTHNGSWLNRQAGTHRTLRGRSLRHSGACARHPEA
jgi:hypothetical protein